MVYSFNSNRTKSFFCTDMVHFMSIQLRQSILRYMCIITFLFPLHNIMQLHKRAQTANPTKHRHQETILKEIKTAIEMQKSDPPRIHAHPRSALQKKSSRPRANQKRQSTQKAAASPLTRRLKEIEQLNCRQAPPVFSLERDEDRICQLGWSEFGERMERATHCHLQRIRKKVHQIRSNPSVSTIFTKGGVKKIREGEVQLGEERLRDIWRMVNGTEKWLEQERFLRVCDLTKDISQSYVLSNAYNACLNSKHYRESPETSFVEQKFKSFVFLRENESRLPRKRLDQLLKDNFFLA